MQKLTQVTFRRMSTALMSAGQLNANAKANGLTTRYDVKQVSAGAYKIVKVVD